MDRRTVLLGMGLSFSAIAIPERSLASSQSLAFYAGRSGRFGYIEPPRVIIGGLIVPVEVEETLKETLKLIANRLNFTVPLRYSTNKGNSAFYREALKAIFVRHSLSLTAVRIKYPDLPSDRAVWEYWRRDIETTAFKEITQATPLKIYTLRHDFGADDRVYRAVQASLPQLTTVKIFDETKISPRLMQLSGAIVKCINSIDRLTSSDSPWETDGNSQKNAMVRETSRILNITHAEDDINNDRLILRNIEL